MVVILALIVVLFSERKEKQSLEAKLQHMEEETFAARINTDPLQKENNQLMQVLNFPYQNFTTVEDAGQMKQLLNTTLLLIEKAQLSQLLEKTLQEKKLLQVEKNELNILLNSTLQSCNLVEMENILLKVTVNQSLHNNTVASADNERLQLLLTSEQQTSKLTFCLRCLPGWTEHASRCFLLSTVAKQWEDARWDCFSMGGDLAVVLNAEDQAFLTNMTFQYTQQHPGEVFHSAWIGLQDMVKEGTHYWVNGNRIQSDLTYWRPSEPNNAIASWASDMAGQDCVAIVPPNEVGVGDWISMLDRLATCPGCPLPSPESAGISSSTPPRP
uniref:C-type lectin domain-containing protein n=1 Tax=Acanthochromis polyacanthus TaxID=80966 RepID=A0A3Q1EIT6_9TELE